MIKKLKQLEKLLKDSSVNGQEICISKDLYTLLVQEEEKTRNLLQSVENGRYQWLLSVALGELVSEQIGEFYVPAKWISEEIINAYRERIRCRKEWENYVGDIDKKEIDFVVSRLWRIANKWPRIKKSIDAFLKKPWGVISIYEIKQDCYMNEILKNLWYQNEDDLMQNFKNMTTNLSQIDRAYKNKELKYKEHYVTICIIDEKFIPLYIYCHNNNDRFHRWEKWKIDQGTKLLLFNATEIDEKTKDTKSKFSHIW